MTAQDFLDWMAACRFTKAAEVAAALGLGRNNAQQLVTAAKAGDAIEVKRAVALAMRATAHGLKPWAE